MCRRPIPQKVEVLAAERFGLGIIAKEITMPKAVTVTGRDHNRHPPVRDPLKARQVQNAVGQVLNKSNNSREIDGSSFQVSFSVSLGKCLPTQVNLAGSVAMESGWCPDGAALPIVKVRSRSWSRLDF